MVQQATRTHVVHMHMFMCMCADVVHVETLFRASTASPTRKRETEVRTTRHRTVPATCYTWPRQRVGYTKTGPRASPNRITQNHLAAHAASAAARAGRERRTRGERGRERRAAREAAWNQSSGIFSYMHADEDARLVGCQLSISFLLRTLSSFRSSQPPSAGHRHPRGGTDSPRRSPRGRRQASASRRPCLQGVGSSPESRRPVPAQR